MSKIIKDSQLHIRCTAEQKADVKEILRRMGKTSDFIVEQFLNTYSDTAADLEIQQYFIEKELSKIDDEVNRLNADAERLKVRYNAINNEIKNKTLYDISYYANDEAVIKSVDSVKSYVMERKITNFNDIPNNTFDNICNTFKVSDKDLIIEISKNEFNKWQDEISEIDTKAKEDNDIKKMQQIANRLNNDFKSQYKYTDWKDYIETRNDYIENRAEREGLHPVDLKLYLSSKNYDHKKKSKKH